MLWPTLFIIGYLIGAIGTGIVVADAVKRAMACDRDPFHADPDDVADAQLLVIAVVVGVAALWPVVMPLYYVNRFFPSQVS